MLDFGLVSFERVSELVSQFMPLSTLLTLALTLLLTVVFLYKFFWNQDTWEKYGVKHMNFGIMEMADLAEKAMEGDLDTVGTWRGKLVLFTRDLDLIRKITVTDFGSFINHADCVPTTSPLGDGLFFLRDDKWKRVRQIMSPSFSTGKLRGMSDVMHSCAERLVAVIEEKARTGQLVRIYHLVGQYTSSIIARTAFGLHTEDGIGQEIDDKFTHCAKHIFKQWPSKFQRYVVLHLTRMKWLHKLLAKTFKIAYVDQCSSESRDYLAAAVSNVLEQREQIHREGKDDMYRDFLQSMVTAKVAGDDELSKANRSVPNRSESHTTESARQKKTLTHYEVIAQSFIILTAGFETTATSIQFSLYMLAVHPQIQEKVYEEIQEVVQAERPSHDELAKLQYMDRVINETMRVLPSVTAMSRDTNETRTYGDITIPAGATIILPIREIHRDPKHWPNPEKFDPDRFTEEEKAKRDPLAFSPFGWGPRLCIGSRLALQEMKILLVYILRKFILEVNEKTVPRKGEKPRILYQELPRVDPPILLQARLRG